MPESVIIFVPAATEQSSVVNALRRTPVPLRVCGTPDDVLHVLIAARGVTVLVTALRDARGLSTTPLIRRVHAGFPGVAVIAYGALTPEFVRDVLRAASAGLAAVGLRDHDDLAAMLAATMQSARRNDVAARAMSAVEQRLTRVTRPIVRTCLERAHAAPAVADVATLLGISRKTVALRLASERLPSASELVGWGRVLLASRLLEDAARSVEQVALGLGFDSGTALRHMLQRYTRLRAAEVRANGGLEAVLPMFARMVFAAARRTAATSAACVEPPVTPCHLP